jgi:membrane-bound serine protease (ClpP class)
MNLNELLLQPNIAYLFLVGGFLLAMMALLTPGTGVFEIGALIVLLLAGWEVYNLPINWWAFIVLVIGVFPFMLAVRRSKNLWYLVLSILALIIGSTFLFKGDGNGLQPAVNPVLAIVVSALTAGFMWLITVKTLEAQTSIPTHDLGSLIGAIGVAKTDIHLEGTVFINMEDWSAQSENLIPAGSEVRIMDRQGFVLNVEPVSQEN